MAFLAFCNSKTIRSFQAQFYLFPSVKSCSGLICYKFDDFHVLSKAISPPNNDHKSYNLPVREIAVSFKSQPITTTDLVALVADYTSHDILNVSKEIQN